MRKITRDNFPHLVACTNKLICCKLSSIIGSISATWWGVQINAGSVFNGLPKFRRHPESQIIIGPNCTFNSSSTSNLIGINRPCIISTLKENAVVKIGSGCGFSGTIIGSACKIELGKNVRCGANTLITDSDWHFDDYRSNPPKPVVIEDNVWLGVATTVLKGVTIGKGTLVGAGSIVTKSLPSNVIAAGNPATVVGKLNPGVEEVIISHKGI